MEYFLYPVFGGREQYRRAPLDEVERKTGVWLATRKYEAEMRRREDAKLAAALGGKS